MPHTGRLLESGIYRKAMEFINAVSVRTVPKAPSLEAVHSPFELVGNESIILDTVKRGEDDESSGEKSIIVRMFESLGGRSNAVLKM